MQKKESKNNKLLLIPKIEKYMDYMIGIILNLPRTEKFSIGNEYKLSMYRMLEKTLYLTKLEDKQKCLDTVNSIDTELNVQRMLTRIMLRKKWIDYRKFEIIMNLIYEQLKNMNYKHGGYKTFYITEPKLRKIEKSRYIDRIVHRWLVDNILEPYFVPTFIESSFACLKNKGMHKSAKYLQNAMKKAKNCLKK